MFKSMKLSIKLIGGFLIVAIVTLVVGAVGLYGTNKINSYLDEIGDVRLPSIESLLIINESQTSIKAAKRSLLVKGLATEGEEQLTIIDNNLIEIQEAWDVYAPLPQTTEEAKVWEEFKVAWAKWQEVNSTFLELAKTYRQTLSDEDYNNMLSYEQNNKQVFYEAEKLLNSLVEINGKIADESNKKSGENVTFIVTLSIICMVFGTLLAIAFGIYLSRSISKPIIAAVEDLKGGTSQIASASEQLLAASEQLAEGSTEQAASIQEISATMEESSAMIEQNTSNTMQVAELAEDANNASSEGANEMKSMMNSMDEIKESSSEIGKIIKVIDEIAFQTNILALNAAVEAARAGQAGKGFAVVAEEVRNLAQRSARAANDTSEIIEKNILLSEQGVNAAAKVNESLISINDKVSQVNSLIADITNASREQAEGISQVNNTIVEIDKVTQINAANSEETSAASQELSAQAATLKDIADTINKLVNGAKSQ